MGAIIEQVRPITANTGKGECVRWAIIERVRPATAKVPRQGPGGRVTSGRTILRVK